MTRKLKLAARRKTRLQSNTVKPLPINYTLFLMVKILVRTILWAKITEANFYLQANMPDKKYKYAAIAKWYFTSF